jgi:aminoglycoside phosphotransferase (APT) family kinase protein
MIQPEPPEERTDTIAVREAHAFDVASLERYLVSQVELAGPLHVRQFRGGQSNPTYLLESGAQRYVLRRKPPGALLPSAHAVDREFRVMRALRDTAVPVPRALCYCADDAVIGTAFFVMDYVDGRVYWEADLPDRTRTQRAAIYDELNRVIAALHSLEPDALGLADFGKAGNYVQRQIARWTSQYRASQDGHVEAMERLIEWLPRHVPAEGRAAITHGDYRLDNVIFARESPRILAVIDWELATLGDPAADFAYHCMTWRLPTEVRRGLRDFDLPGLGIPTESEYLRRYCERTGRASIPDFDYYVAFNLFRLAAILQGVAARARLGNASSARAAECGELAPAVAKVGWEQAERMTSA